jgi:cell division protein FtsZ
MNEMGKAMMGTGEADGENRALQAAEKAIANPLLDEISLKGARGVLINVTGGYDLTLFELDEAANRIREEVDPDANIIVGSTLDTEMEGKMRVSVVATGIDAVESRQDIAPSRTYTSAVPKAAPKPEEFAAPVEADVEPVAAAASPVDAEPSLFGGFEAADEDELYFTEDEETAVPPPAYRPAPAAVAPQPAPRAVHSAERDGQYVAPKPAAAGTPTPEALARLRAAIQKDKPREAAPAETAQRAEPTDAHGKPRFGINSLINRMTGHAEEGGAAPERRQPTMTQAPRPAMTRPTYDDGGVDPDQERIEIPAFLRRQAN